MSNHTEQLVNTLMREYELHKQELLLQIDLYNRQTKYIQVYGAILLALIAFIFGVSPQQSKLIGIQTSMEQVNEAIILTDFIILVLLIFAAAVAFYLVSTIMATLYMFQIIRRRMTQIEDKVNSLLDYPKLLSYETIITPHFLEKGTYGDGLYTPHALSNLGRIALFTSIIIILIWIAKIRLQNPWAGFIYSFFVSFISLFLVTQYYALYKKGKEYIGEFYLDWSSKHQKKFPPAFWHYLVTGLSIITIILSNFYFLNYWKTFYGLFSINTLQTNDLQLAFYIFVYEIFCAIFLFTPSEAPLLLSKAPVLLYPRLSLLTIIIILYLHLEKGSVRGLFVNGWIS